MDREKNLNHIVLKISNGILRGHGHNVSAYLRGSVNAWGVVHFASTMYTGQSVFPSSWT